MVNLVYMEISGGWNGRCDMRLVFDGKLLV